MSLSEQLGELLASSTGKIFLKRLSRNDQTWADDDDKHQDGFYVPRAVREAGFFPRLIQRADKPHIYDIEFETEWPQVETATRKSRLVHYSNKGSEAHVTRIPREAFAGSPPASLLVCTQVRGRAAWRFLIIPSGSIDFEDAEELFDLSPAFESGIVSAPAQDPDEALAAAILEALEHGALNSLIGASRLDDGRAFAEATQRQFLDESKLASFDAFGKLKSCGDVLRELCDRQYRVFAQKEKKLRAAELVRTLAAVHPKLSSAKEIVRAVVFSFPELLELFKSLRGARASRMGKALEYHLHRILRDSAVPFSFQPKVGGRTPDFVLPSMSLVGPLRGSKAPALVLAAKSTLRERWQQILNEVVADQIFLLTIDPAITASSIADMKKASVTLIVPEAFVDPKGAYYAGNSNVLSLSHFLQNTVKSRLESWAKAAAP